MTAAVESIEGLPGTVFDQERDLTGGMATAVFDSAEAYRYLLTRVWDPARPIACWLMLNPSTADAAHTDNTLTRVVSFSSRFGAGGCAIVNLFAVRSRHPQILTTHPDPIGKYNDLFIRHTVRTTTDAGGPVIAAWGTWGDHNKLQDRTQHVRDLLRDTGRPVHCLGTTSPATNQQPLHPLMLNGRTDLTPYTPDTTA